MKVIETYLHVCGCKDHGKVVTREYEVVDGCYYPSYPQCAHSKYQLRRIEQTTDSKLPDVVYTK